MSLSRTVVALAVLGAVAAVPVAAQGIPRGGTIGGRPRAAAPRVLVAIPYVYQSADSAAAVTVGSGLREEFSDIVGRDYAVIPDTQMNAALTTYGYPPNAILSPSVARTLAANMRGRYLVTSTMSRADNGQHSVVARLVGISDDAGQVVTHIQQPGQDLEDFGAQIAEAFDPAVEALEDARECVAQRQQNPDDAREAAENALETVPNHGLASYCLARLTIDQNGPATEVIRYLRMAVQGDSLSLPAWTLLAEQYQQAGDTSQMLYAFENMLRIAPNNPALREELLRQFLNLGQIDRAKRVAEEGLAVDPYNADMYDLKSNVCLFASDFVCAVEALEQAYAVDSTRVDTLFFAKIGVAAEQRLADSAPPVTAADTATYLEWARRGAARFPNNATLLQNLAKAYGITGQVDSTVAALERLYPVDSAAALRVALVSAQELIEARTADTAAVADSAAPVDTTADTAAVTNPFVEFVQRHGSTEQKDQLGGIYLNAATKFMQQENLNYQRAAQLSRHSAALVDPAGRYAAPANFVLGFSAFQLAAAMDAETERRESCALAREEKALLDESGAALAKGQSYRPEIVTQFQGYLEQFNTRVNSMIQAYCG